MFRAIFNAIDSEFVYLCSTTVAGWAANTIKGDASVFVFEKDYDKAMLLLDEINAAEMEEE